MLSTNEAEAVAQLQDEVAKALNEPVVELASFVIPPMPRNARL
jgi:hypothetical protein